jgi:hypothetical protein
VHQTPPQPAGQVGQIIRTQCGQGGRRGDEAAPQRVERLREGGWVGIGRVDLQPQRRRLALVALVALVALEQPGGGRGGLAGARRRGEPETRRVGKLID